MQQLFFNFPIKPTYLTEDFFISPANNEAFTYLNKWPEWDSGIYSKTLLLYGEDGSGKTHLSHIWKSLSNAEIITQDNCYNLNQFISYKALILEDIELIDEESILHLINFSNENQQYLLLTSKYSPTNLKYNLADLRSRILSIPSIALNSPEPELLKAVLLKHLSDRQLKINPITLEYIVIRIDRSFSKLSQFIQEIDKETNTSKRPITIPLVKEILKI